MKKTLVAIAALTAVSAFAQSSVTIYGRVNEGLTTSKAEDKAGQVTKSFGAKSNTWTSSRFGVNVNEDLGSGTSAQAVWESNIGVTAGEASTSTVRQAFVGLKDSKLGGVQLGAVYTPEYTQGITVAGTVNGVGFGGGALIVSSAAAKTNVAVHRLGTIDQSNMVNYTAPKMGDLTLSAQWGSTAAEKSGTTGGANVEDAKGSIMGLSANYAKGPLNATASYVTAKTEAIAVAGTAFAAGTATTAPTQYVAAVSAADRTQKNTTLSATYELGAAKLFGYYANREVSGTTTRDYKTYNVGATYTMGALTPFVSMSSGKMKDATTDLMDLSASQVGVSYAFSKRTNAYLYQTSYKDDKATTTSMSKASETSLGVAHQF
jgi:predicted porin